MLTMFRKPQVEMIQGVEVPLPFEAVRLLEAERRRIQGDLDRDYDKNLKLLIEIDEKINALLQR